MKKFFLFAAFLILLSNLYSQDFEVKKSYDKFSKTTTILLDEKLIIKGTGTIFNLVSYSAVNYSQKDTIYEWFFWKFTNKATEIASVNDKISLMIDDSIIKIIPNSVKSEVDKIYYSFIFSKDNFLKIANGKIVDIQIKNPDFIYEGRFKDDDLKILRSFLKKY